MATLKLPSSFRRIILQTFQEAAEEWGDDAWDPALGISYMAATVATGEIANRLGVHVESELDHLHSLLKRSMEKRPSPKDLRSIREYFPKWQSTSGDSSNAVRYSVDVFEKLVINVLSRRELPHQIFAGRPGKELVSEQIALWTWEQQEWWRRASKQLGSDGGRALIVGILRSLLQDFFKPQRISDGIASTVDILEDYAMTGKRTSKIDQLAKKSLKWKYNFRHLEAAAVILLNYRTIDSFSMGEAYGNLAAHAEWTPLRAFSEAELWFRSIIPIGRKPNIKTAWCSESVMDICESMIRIRRYDRFQDLGKCLSQAGCDNQAIIDHCSNPKQRHMRADWLLTSILQKRK